MISLRRAWSTDVARHAVGLGNPVQLHHLVSTSDGLLVIERSRNCRAVRPWLLARPHLLLAKELLPYNI